MAGYFVPSSAASSQTAAPEGFYVSAVGASAATRALYSYFVGQTASQEEPLTNNNSAASSLPALNMDNKVLKVIQTLQSQRNIQNNSVATLEVGSGFTLQLSGALSGSGAYTQTGTGQLILDTNLPGSLQINSGSAIAKANVVGNVAIAQGAIFQAGPSVGSINNLGTLKVGAGGLNVVQSLTAASTSTTEIQLNGSTPALTVQGTSVLGGTLKVMPSSGVNLQADQTYNLIQFGSTYSGTFSSINTLDFVGYKLTAIYGASDLSFKVQWLSLLPRATNSNQSSAASALDQLVPSAGADLRGIISGISNASNALSASALSQINPRTLHIQSADRSSNILELVQQFRSANAFTQISPQFRAMNLQASAKENVSAWVSSNHNKTDVAADQNMVSRSNTVSSQTVGIDFSPSFEKAYRLGMSLSKMRLNTQSTPYTGQDDADIATMYSMIQAKDKRVDLYAFFGQGNAQQTRNLDLPSVDARSAISTASTSQYGLGGRLQWQAAGQMLQPFVGASTLLQRTAAFNEANAGAANLSVNAHKSKSQSVELGLTLRSPEITPALGTWRWLVELSGNASKEQTDDVVQRLEGTSVDMKSAGDRRSSTGTKLLAAASLPIDRLSSLQLSASARNSQGQSVKGMQVSYRLSW